MEKLKFDLKTRKLLNNSNINIKDLPGFEDGTTPTQYEPLWNNVWNKSFQTPDGSYTVPASTTYNIKPVEGVSPVYVNNQIA
jgi:hypothetical protein